MVPVPLFSTNTSARRTSPRTSPRPGSVRRSTPKLRLLWFEAMNEAFM
jgi:hypothetical protein